MNPMANGSIGTMHGKMHGLVRNTFRSDFMRKNYDAAISTYDSKHKNFIYASGRRCLGNAWAGNFWRGFDGIQRNWDANSKQSPAYAMWCAGRDIRAAIDAADVIAHARQRAADERAEASRRVVP